jgi:HPt (histidine-containing phosphotransfer) domain-containing protein
MKTSAKSGAPAEALSQAMDRLWVRFLPEIRDRVAILESAAASVAQRNLTASDREAAKAAAHKLAGVLGTFNLARGTDLARELEAAYSREAAFSPASAKTLGAAAADLRDLIEKRQSNN